MLIIMLIIMITNNNEHVKLKDVWGFFKPGWVMGTADGGYKEPLRVLAYFYKEGCPNDGALICVLSTVSYYDVASNHLL